MQSRTIVFPEREQVELRQEAVAAPGPHQILCQAVASLISTGTETFCLRGVADPGTNWSAWLQRLRLHPAVFAARRPRHASRTVATSIMLR